MIKLWLALASFNWIAFLYLTWSLYKTTKYVRPGGVAFLLTWSILIAPIMTFIICLSIFLEFKARKDLYDYQRKSS